MNNHSILTYPALMGVIAPLFSLALPPVASIAAPPPPPEAITYQIASSAPYFIEVKQDERRDNAFINNWGELKRILGNARVQIDEQWVGESRLYLKVSLPTNTIQERNALLETLRNAPLVASIISAESANAVLKDLPLLAKIDGKASVPEPRLRGLREKRTKHSIDIKAPHTGEILVKYLEETTSSKELSIRAQTEVENLHAKHGGHVKQRIRHSDGSRTDVVEIGKTANFAQVIQTYIDSPLVEYAQPNYIYEASATPNDARYSELWGMPKIQAPTAWDTRTSSGNVVVAVVDSGIDYNHADLAANMWHNPNEIINGMDDDGNGIVDDIYGANFVGATATGNPMDDNMHGTHVAGTIGAVGNNGLGVAGVAWDTQILAVKVLDSYGRGTTTSTVAGLDYARTKGAKIINASWGWAAGAIPQNDQALRDAIARLQSAGILFVCAANNYGNNNDAIPTYPGNYNLPNMVVVGASDSVDARSIWSASTSSHWGHWSVDVFAPGTNILSTLPNNAYGSLNGTSMATPHVSGMLALAKAQFPYETAPELAARARFSTDSIAALNSLCVSNGRINATKALGERPRTRGLSTRCQVNSGSEIGIAGIIISGPSSKRVVFRAHGPSLTSAGLGAVISNPQITIYNASGQAIGFNDNWGTLTANERNELAAQQLTPNHALESAWVATLAPGAYTVHLAGVGGGTGIGIVDCYDLDGSSINRLSHVSTRCYVGTGDQVAIAGTIVVGDKPRQFYIRGMGPSLNNWGVANALQDPEIRIYNQNGQQIDWNDNWRDYDGTSTALENRLSQTGSPPNDNRESAMLLTLPQGAYTVILSGKNGSTGVGLIEINEI